MEGRVSFLGTGSSVGIPVIGCSCGVCRSHNPYNIRFRSSVIVEIEGKILLIDAGPDHRSQALAFGLRRPDGVLFTHGHYDHIAGVGDLKVYCKNEEKLPCIASEATWQELEKKFSYLFSKGSDRESPFFVCHTIKDSFEEREFLGISMKFLRFFQAGMPVTGVRIGELAYLSDIKIYEERLFQELEGIRTLVISCVRDGHSEMHFSVEEALDFAKKTGARTVYLTHIGHEIDHDILQNRLPSGFFVAYDGLRFSFQRS